ncbi:MAG: DNA polymerase III subunit delta' [Gammaproteobacteria bacterium]|nr:DNA polymerase III subunit delta' [Gammaproteobacteria bacterium]
MSAPYPWQAGQWGQICRNAGDGRLAHALLLHGRSGLGKHAFAQAVAGMLLCESRASTGAVCGSCRGCTLFRAGNHPDFRAVSPLEDSTTITIDQIRALIDFYTLKAHYLGPKVVLLHPADVMNRAASNALLKVLEEPPAGATFLLVANAYDRITPTIRSRCQALAMDKFDDEIALAWLAATVDDTAAAADLHAAFQLANRTPLGARDALAAGLPRLAGQIGLQMEQVARGRLHASQAAQRCAEAAPALTADLMYRRAHQLLVELPATAPTDSIGLRDALHSQRLFKFIDAVTEVKGLCLAPATYRDGDLLDMLWRAWMQAWRPVPTELQR